MDKTMADTETTTLSTESLVVVAKEPLREWLDTRETTTSTSSQAATKTINTVKRE